jgi:hypothetical protein
MRVFNQALLARKAWRLLERPNSLCARLLKAKYYKSGSLLDTVFPVNASPVWKGIEYGLELLKKGVIWRIGNGERVKVWRDPWIPYHQEEFVIYKELNNLYGWMVRGMKIY